MFKQGTLDGLVAWMAMCVYLYGLGGALKFSFLSLFTIPICERIISVFLLFLFFMSQSAGRSLFSSIILAFMHRRTFHSRLMALFRIFCFGFCFVRYNFAGLFFCSMMMDGNFTIGK